MSGFAFLRGRDHPYFAVAVLIGGKVGAGGISLLAFMLMAASVSAADMSAYAIAVAIVSVFSVASESSEFAYVRTVAEASRFARPVALRFMVGSKAVTIALCALILFALPLIGRVLPFSLPRWIEILPAVCMQAIMTCLIGGYTTWLVGEDRQKEFTQVSLLNALMAVVAACGVWLFGEDVVFYLMSYTGLLIGLFLFIFGDKYEAAIRFWRLANVQFLIGGARSARSTVQYKSVYAAVRGGAYLAVVKNNALIFFLGHQNDESVLATFIVTKRVFDFVHKGMAGFLEQLYIRLSKMADEQGVGIQGGIGVLYVLRVVVMILVGLLLVVYFNFFVSDPGGFSLLALMSVMGAFLVMYFVTIATLIVSKYEPQALFRNAVFTAIVHSIVPIIFLSVSVPAFTTLSHVLASVISGLPLCLLTFYRRSYYRVIVWYSVTLVVGFVGLLLMACAE